METRKIKQSLTTKSWDFTFLTLVFQAICYETLVKSTKLVLVPNLRNDVQILHKIIHYFKLYFGWRNSYNIWESTIYALRQIASLSLLGSLEKCQVKALASSSSGIQKACHAMETPCALFYDGHNIAFSC